MMVACRGNGPDHCCWIAGQVCQYLEMNTVPGRIFACGLMREHGDWEAVHSDVRYLADVKPRLVSITDVDCGDWPPPGVTCATCGVMNG